ncbi:glycosyltransferase family 2 protein [Pedobacter rhodius]|uniref:Glycosyltransferase family 2 protein n=1 Tax=Pedobacter rhodius TaxID=3004098 RepID=A0ABT4KZK3_9SPHI|nr:glycosyltransferase family 2 protein [Pedobacter sp. SJ11]MCZ4224352.1 glycosyltransferase family 2 protein [Pedobacter sp. SJ11]
MNKPLVSIIIPTYNYAKLITETLESVLGQSYDAWECIIVDDGSTDNTEDIVKDFINCHSTYSFTYIKKVNEGTSVAKNTGVNIAAGKYVQFLDADDLISVDKLAVQVSLLESGIAGVVFSKSVFFTDDNSRRKLIDRYPNGFLAEETLHGSALLKRMVKNNIVTIGSPLVKKDILLEAGLFDTELKNNEDWLLWFKVGVICRKFVYDDNIKSYTSIRVHHASAMNNHSKMFQGEVIVRREIESALSGSEADKELEQLRKLNSELLALHEVRSLNIANGMRYILSSFAKNPVGEFNLLTRALFKLGVRIYKSAIS